MSRILRTVFAKPSGPPTENADERSTPDDTETEKSTPPLESKEEVAETGAETAEASSKDGPSAQQNDAVQPLEKQEKETEVKEATKDDVDEHAKYPGGTKLGLLTFGLAMATFVVALDNTIIATAIPRITTEFDSLSPLSTWFISSMSC